MNRKQRRRNRTVEKKSSGRGARSLPPNADGTTHDPLISGTPLPTVLGRAVALHQSGQLAEALDLYRQILAVQPERADVIYLAGTIMAQAGQIELGIEMLRKATHLDPDFPDAHYNLGTLLQQAGRPEDAEDAFRRALDIRPNYLEAHYNLGNGFLQMGRFDEAIASYDNVLRLNDKFVPAHVNGANAQLQQGNASAALTACDGALATDPGNRDALAFKAIALSELGQRDAAGVLIDFERFIRPFAFDAPSGFESLEDFNRSLVDHVCTHPTLTEEPANKATRFGKQTTNLLVEPKGPVAALEELIWRAVNEYLAGLAGDPDHPYIASMPRLSAIDAWGTVLESQGHQEAHMHRAAWVSGVYYVQIPEAIRDEGQDHAGWIEFGRPASEYPCESEPEVRLFRPEEGLMLLFPSYYFHRTIPFESPDLRISIAFDLLAEG